MIKDYATFAFLNFKSRKLRTALTILGIVIGIAAVVSLISIGQGLNATLEEQFRALGGDKIIITPRGSSFGTGAPQSDIELDETDLDAIERVRGIESAGGMIFKIGQVEFHDEQKSTYVSGVPQDETKEIFTEINTLDVVEGRDLRSGDRNSALIGILLAQGDYFKKPVRLRDTLTIDGHEVKVVGVLGRIGNPQDDSQLIVPLDFAREIFDEPTQIDFIMAKTQAGFDPADVSDSVTRELRRHRNVEEDKEDFSVQTFDQILATFNDIFAVVQAILIGIAAISLLVGGIGIMNTMYTAVLQRTREIGLMKSIGARNKDIALLFIIESGFLGLAGGTIGVLIGLGVGLLVKIGADLAGIAFSTQTSPLLIIGSLLFSFLCGSLAGVAPAMSASALKPVDALRYE